MAAVTTQVAITNSWSVDVAEGFLYVLIQRTGENPVVVHVGTSAPSAASNVGINLAGDKRELYLAPPAMTVGDKIYIKGTAGASTVVLVRT